MKIYIGADHRGFDLKEFLKKKLLEENFEVEDVGNFVYDPNDDYSDFALALGEKIRDDKDSKGILICGSGAGVCFAVNKVKRIRASLAFNPEMAKMMTADDNINVLCLTSDFTQKEDTWQIVKAFLETKFKNEEKYIRRIKKIEEYENKNYSSNQ